MHMRGSPTGPVNRKTRNDQNRTRTRAGRNRQFGSFGVSDLQSSEASEIGAVHIDSQRAVPNFRSSEVVDARTAAHGTSMMRMRRRADHRCLVAGASRGCSRIGNRRGKVFTQFSPVPPPLPGCAGFPTSRPQQVDYGRLGSKEVAVGQGKTKSELAKGGRTNDATDDKR